MFLNINKSSSVGPSHQCSQQKCFVFLDYCTKSPANRFYSVHVYLKTQNRAKPLRVFFSAKDLDEAKDPAASK